MLNITSFVIYRYEYISLKLIFQLIFRSESTLIKMGEGNLNNAENLFKSIYNDSPIGIEIYNSKGKLIDLNQSCMELFGISHKDDVKGFNLLNDPNIPKQYLRRLKQRKNVRYESVFDFDLVKKKNLYRTTKSGKICIDVLITPLFLEDHKFISNYLVQIQDITQRKTAEKKLIDLNEMLEKKIQAKTEQLKKSERRYQLISENLNDMLTITNERGQIEYINDEVHKKKMGYSIEDLMSHNAFELIHPDDREQITEGFKETLKKGQGFTEARVLHKEGHYLWTETNGKTFVDIDGKLKVLTISRDITDRKMAEKLLKESEQKFRMISDQSLVGIVIVQDGIIKYVNKQMEMLSDYSNEEMQNWKAGEFLKIIHPNYRELVAEQSKKKQMGLDGVIDKYEIIGIKKSGEYIWVDNYSKTITYEGHPAVLSILIDITEKKTAELKLKKSEQELIRKNSEIHTIFNTIPAMLNVVDKEYNVIEVSDEFAKVFHNGEKEKAIGKKCYQAHKQRNSICPECTVKSVFQSGKIETRLSTPNEGVITGKTLKIYSAPIKDENGVISGAVEAIMDISDIKKAEEKIRESEKRLMDLIEAVPIGISISTPDGKIIECNSYLYQIFGYDSKEEFLKTPATELYYDPNDRERFIELIKSESVKDFEAKFKRRDGSIIWGSLISVAQIMGDQERIINSFQDITNRKENEIRIQQSEAELNAIYNYTPIAILLLDNNQRIRKINKFALNFTDRKEEEVSGIHGGEALRCLYSIKDPRGCGFSEHCMDCTIRNTVLDTFKTKIPHINVGATLWLLPGGDNDKIYLLISTVPLNFDGEDLVLISLIDITERKKVEENLRESEERYRNFIENFQGIAFQGYQDFTASFFHGNLEKITGYKEEDFISGRINWDQLIHPEDLKEINKKVKRFHKSSDETDKREYRIISKNGKIRWLYEYNQKVYDNTLKKEGVRGIIIDNTKYKKAEQLIIESEEKYRKLFNNAPFAIVLFDTDGFILDCNDSTSKITGYYKDELVGNNFKEFEFYANIETAMVELFEKAIKDGEVPAIRKVLIYKKDKSQFWGRTYIDFIHLGDETYIQAIIQDVTEQWIAEEKLKESERRYRELFENSPISLWEQDLSELKNYLDKLQASGINDFEKYFNDYPEEILRCISKIKIIDLNQKTVELYKANNKEELIDRQRRIIESFDLKFFTEDTIVAHKKELLSIIKGDLSFEHETITKNFTGDLINLYVKTLIIPGYEENFSKAIVSLINITERKRAEKELKESEEKYRNISKQYKMLLESITDGIYALNRNWEYILVNKNAEKLFSMPVEKLLGHKIFEVFPGIENTPFFKRYESVMNVRNPERIINSLTFPDGHIGYYEVSIYPIEEGILCIGKDVTEEKAIEQRIKESEEKFRTIAEQSSLGMIIQQEGFIKFANSAVSDIIEYPIEEILQWTVKDTLKFIYKEDLPLIVEKLRQRQEGDFETENRYECRATTKFGKSKWIEVYTKPITYQGRNAILSTFIDITEKKEIEEKLKEISILKSDLLSRTSHELKTPLVAIKGYADLLLTVHYENLDFQTISIVHEIKQGCSRLEALIKDLLATSKLESEEIELEKSEEDLSFLIKFCINDLKGLAETRNHMIIFNIHDKMVTMFEKERIYEVIANLLSNAIKYTPPNGKIQINSKEEDGFYTISIEDNGIGLTDEEKGKIFKKFGKVERYGKGLDVISEGTGLGLYISKKIIELHGGKIRVESGGRNKGSIFHFSLPIIKE